MQTTLNWLRWLLLLALLGAGPGAAPRVAPSTSWPDARFVGAYRSQEFAQQGETRWFGLELMPDAGARITFPPVAGSNAIYVRAMWQNHGNGTITVTQLADIDAQGGVLHTYEPPLLFSMLIWQEGGALFAASIVLPDGSQPLFAPRASE